MQCVECGHVAKERHHIIPKSLGGKVTVPLCSKCHSKVHGLGKKRYKHNDLTRIGLYRLESERFFCVFAWYTAGVPELKKDWAKSYEEFTTDKLSNQTLVRRIKTIESWIENGMWDYFLWSVNGSPYMYAEVCDLLYENYDLGEYDIMLWQMTCSEDTNNFIREHRYIVNQPRLTRWIPERYFLGEI